MASEIKSGSSNFTITNNTSQNLRIVINYMSGTPSGDLTINWAGVSITGGNIEAIGKNLAAASGVYGDFGFSGFIPFGWWKKIAQTFYPVSSLNTQNIAVRYPGASGSMDTDINKRGWKKFFREGSSTDITSFSFAVAFPTEIFLSTGQSLSAVCGPYNVVAIREDGA